MHDGTIFFTEPSKSTVPELVIFIGIQATGKTTFYRERFLTTHVHISLDLLTTRYREERFLALCLETRINLVIDNTNPATSDRQRYIVPARSAGFRVRGYYFQSRIEAALARNASRVGSARIPDIGVRGCAGRLQRPSLHEGFDQLAFVAIQPAGGFLVEPWNDPAPAMDQ